MAAAACSGYPADWWSPEGDPDSFQLGEVREICSTCPVRRACLDYGLAMDGTDRRIPHGIYAGLTDGQRSSLRRGVCIGCRREEDPANLWGRVGNWRHTGLCGACDSIRAHHRAVKAANDRARRTTDAVPPPLEVLEAEAEWWSRQRAALSR